MNAKRPLPVTPCFVEPADDAVDTDQESVSTTPSSTEFVFLMEQLQMSPSQDKDQDVPGIFDLTHTMNLTLNIASSSNYSVAGLKEPLCTILVFFFFTFRCLEFKCDYVMSSFLGVSFLDQL